MCKRCVAHMILAAEECCPSCAETYKGLWRKQRQAFSPQPQTQVGVGAYLTPAEGGRARAQEGTALCECEHFKNCHVSGSGKCVFAKLQAAYGYRDPECPCKKFVPKNTFITVKDAKPAIPLCRNCHGPEASHKCAEYKP